MALLEQLASKLQAFPGKATAKHNDEMSGLCYLIFSIHEKSSHPQSTMIEDAAASIFNNLAFDRINESPRP